MELVQWLASADKVPLIVVKNAPSHQHVTGRLKLAIHGTVNHSGAGLRLFHKVLAPVGDLVRFDVRHSLDARPDNH